MATLNGTNRSRRTVIVRTERRPARSAQSQIIEHEPMKPGLHLAPFLHGYGGGGFSLIAIDQEGACAGMFNVTAGNGFSMLDVYTGRGPMERQRQNIEPNDIALFSDIRLVREFTLDWWNPGVHLAPWKPRFLAGGVVLVGIAQSGNIWGIHEAPQITNALLEEVRDSLSAAAVEGSGGVQPSIIDYEATDTVDREHYRYLLRVAEQYKQDRAEYGRLIGLGPAASEADDDEPPE